MTLWYYNIPQRKGYLYKSQPEMRIVKISRWSVDGICINRGNKIQVVTVLSTFQLLLSLSPRINTNSAHFVGKQETSASNKLHVEASCQGNTCINFTQLSAKLSHRSRTNSLHAIPQWNVGSVSEHLVPPARLLQLYTSDEDLSSA